VQADLTARTLRIGVTELVARAAERGVGFSARGGSRAAWLGAALHARYQAAAKATNPDYRAEVALRRTIEIGDWSVELRGRCDGLRPAAGPETETAEWVIEELKTGRRLPSAKSLDVRGFVFQARLYAFMASESLAARCAANWIWIPAGGDDPIVHPIPDEPAALDAELAQTVARVIAEVEREETVRKARRTSAASVRFPFANRRDGQEEIERAVMQALESGEHLLLQAPTGIGKTAAVLTPVVRHVLARDQRAFVATASTLQQHGTVATLRAIDPGGIGLAARIRAKRRMCATETMLCHPVHCDHAESYGQRLRESGALERCISGSPILEPETVWREAVQARLCPFELSLDAADRLPITVGDCNYVFDPVVALPRWSDPDELADAVLIVDEAHRLPARARDALSNALAVSTVQLAIEQAALGGAPIHHRQRLIAEGLARYLEDEVEDALQGVDGTVLREPDPERVDGVFGELDLGVEETLAVLDGAMAEGPHKSFLELAWQAFAWRAEPLGHHQRVAIREAGDCRLERWCIDPAPALARVFSAASSVIALSATLSPSDLHADLLGLDRDRRSETIVYGAAVRDRQQVVIDPRVSTRFKDRNENEPAITRSISRLLDEVPGNAMILAASFATLERLRPGLMPSRHRLALQRAADGEPERQRMLEDLGESSDLAVLAVAGGALAEGVDTAELGLRLIVVVGPCLPAMDAKSGLLVEHYEEANGAGFDMAIALPGMTRVIQSAGRLLRRDEDYGLVVLYGDRFLRAPYRDWLPEPWLDGEEPEALVADPAEAARVFFAAR
jgi:DNA excision repair protein ERCC-2